MDEQVIGKRGTRAGSPADAPQGFSYFPAFLTEEEQHALLLKLDTLQYTHDVFRGQQLKRSGTAFGYGYAATGRRLQPAAPFPDYLTALLEHALRCSGTDAGLNQCLVQRYPQGAGIGWHTDAPCFGDLILAVSLGGEARLQLRPNGSSQTTYEVVPAQGSLYVMRGTARWDFQHQVLPVKSTRYSLTFRQA